MKSSDGKIIDEESYPVREVIEDGELIHKPENHTVNRKTVYELDNQIVKVYDNLCTENMQRIGAYLPNNVLPDTTVRTKNLSGLKDYEGLNTVIIQEKFDSELTDELKDDKSQEKIGDVVYILDQVVDEGAVMTDPVVENFAYFDDQLQLFDFCAIESTKCFPHSFELKNAVMSYQEEVRHMYQDAIISLEHETNYSMEEVAEAFNGISRYIEDFNITEEVILGEIPEVDVYQSINRF